MEEALAEAQEARSAERQHVGLPGVVCFVVLHGLTRLLSHVAKHHV